MTDNKNSTISHEIDKIANEHNNESFYQIGIGSQIIKDLGLSEIILLYNHNINYSSALDGFDIKIIDYKSPN